MNSPPGGVEEFQAKVTVPKYLVVFRLAHHSRALRCHWPGDLLCRNRFEDQASQGHLIRVHNILSS